LNETGHDGPRPVSIVILTWNGLDYTRACIDSIRNQTKFDDYRIVVADNGSTDGTLEYLRRQSDLTVVENGANLGFAKGNNRALAVCDPASDVILLNNDTEIIQPDWIELMQNTALSSPDIGVVGCRLRRPGGMLQHAGTYMPLDDLWGQQTGAGEQDINQFSQNRDVEGVVFACVYLKREILAGIGFLDEEYFSYFEDTDYCFRVLEAGYRVVCCGAVTVVHHEHVSTAINRVPQKEMFSKAQVIFRRKWEAKLRASKYTREIGWHSIFNFPTGYAISSRELAMALDRQRVHVAYKYVYGPGTLFPVEEPEQSESHMIKVIRSRRPDSRRPQVVYGQGDVFQSNFGAYQIGFTMLETDRIPEEWVRQANLMDEVWCPSEFNARSFRASGVTRPIHVIPLGIDPGYFNPAIQAPRMAEDFTFLSVFEWGERKAPEILLRAFNKEFKARERAILVCKILNVDPGIDVFDQVARLNLDPNGGRIHFSLNHVLPTYQLGVLYRSADCFVLPTRGEGWGMPILEAMACGLPVIATDWSAQCDFMTASNAYPLGLDRLIPAVAKCPYYQGFRWADPSFVDLRRLMRHVYQNPGEARAKGECASTEVLARWTWDHAASKIIGRLDDIASQTQSMSRPYSEP
jgi:GT2 family glycosyltransferase